MLRQPLVFAACLLAACSSTSLERVDPDGSARPDGARADAVGDDALDPISDAEDILPDTNGSTDADADDAPNPSDVTADDVVADVAPDSAPDVTPDSAGDVPDTELGDDAESDAVDTTDTADADDAVADDATDTADTGTDAADTTDTTDVADTGDATDTGTDTATDAAPTCEPLPPMPAAGDGRLPGLAGSHASARVDGFTDEYLIDPTGYIRIGLRREWGGSIVFFGLHNGVARPNNTNTIDANDTGREVQVAFYDPERMMQNCAFDASCLSRPTECAASIRHLGWNPVQGGNRCNIGSGVEEVTFDDGTLRAVVVPLQWNPDWDSPVCGGDGCASAATRERRSDVRVIQSMRFVRTHVVELEYTLHSLSDVNHLPTLQELPTLYSTNGNEGPDLWRLYSADGTHVPIDTDSGNADGFFYENFTSAGPWVTLQNETAEYGVGLFMENGLREYQGWQQRSLPFNNVRARIHFGIPPRGSVRARAYLVLGSLGTVGAESAWLEQNIPPFGALDAPGDTTPFAEAIAVRGWTLDNRVGTRVVVQVNGGAEQSVATGLARPDVCLVWPGYPDCAGPGFAGTASLAGLDASCDHVIDVIAIDADGNRTHLGRRFIEALP